MILIAAESSLGLGWAFAALLVLIMKWGWLAGLGLIAGAYLLRGMKNPVIAFFLIGSVIVGMLLLATSAALQLGFWFRERNRIPAPATEIGHPI